MATSFPSAPEPPRTATSAAHATSSPPTIGHVVVLRALGLGDLCTAVPALRALRRGLPGARITLAAPAALRWVAEASGAVDELVPVGGLDEPLPSGLAGCDLAVNLHGSGPQSTALLRALRPVRLVTFDPSRPTAGPVDGSWSDAEVRVPWRATGGALALSSGPTDAPAVTLGGGSARSDVGPGPEPRPVPEPVHEHEVDRWCRLVRAGLGLPTDPLDLALDADPDELPAPVADGLDAIGAAAYALVHPGAASPARRWPPERFAAVTRHLAELGLPVVLTGSTVERDLAAAVRDHARGRAPAGVERGADRWLVDATGKTDLAGLASLVSGARVVLAGDTGVAHLATALGRPSVVLFGPTPPAVWGPRSAGPHTVLWAGRVGDPHGGDPDPGLLRITVDEVIDALDHQLTAIAA